MNWRAALAGGLSLAAIVVVGVAVVGNPSTSTTPAPSTSSAAPAATPSSSAPAPTVAQGPLPTSITIPKLGVHAILGAPLYLNADGTVQVPDVNHPEVPAWYALDARPGDVGAAVILGHVDGRGHLGVFFGLNKLVAGDQIMVGRADGSTVTFVVTKAEAVLKTQFPSDQVYLPTPDPELRLVSCTGKFDQQTHSYESNEIVFAKKV